LDAYCRILLLARDLGRINYLDEQKTRELLDFKTRLGFTDPRLSPGMENCDICANDIFRDSWKRTGVDRRAFEAPPPSKPKQPSVNGSASIDQEQLIQAITDRVMAEIRGQRSGAGGQGS
ncbi:MAG TPA: class II aldolase/adducin family protein, partial [Pirellulales bacterium]|nr:class II aldolase/adducin family protein [Pirellulales bacterium]